MNVVIPDDWRAMPWFGLRALATKISGAPPKDKGEATAIVEAEQARREPTGPPSSVEISAPAMSGADDGAMISMPPPAPAAHIYIPADWHEKMSVDEIVALARKIDPEGNPVDVIRAEIDRRAA